MMKNLNKLMRISIAAMMLPMASFSQIQDGGFENWDSIPFREGGKNFLPNGWYETANEFANFDKSEWSVTRTNDAYKGNYAIRLKNVLNWAPQNAMLMTKSGSADEVNNKIPIKSKPKSLECYYKFTFESEDSFTVGVYLTKGEDIVGMGTVTKNTQRNDYTKLTLPITYSPASNVTPDSAIVIFTLGSATSFVEGSKLILDEVSFIDNSTGLREQFPALNADVSIWPNPASDEVNVEITGADKRVTVELINALGETIQQKEERTEAGKINVKFDLSALHSGIYFIKVSDDTGSRGFRLVRE